MGEWGRWVTDYSGWSGAQPDCRYTSTSDISPCTTKSRRRSLLAPAHPGSPRKRAVKRLCECVFTCRRNGGRKPRWNWITPVHLENGHQNGGSGVTVFRSSTHRYCGPWCLSARWPRCELPQRDLSLATAASVNLCVAAKQQFQAAINIDT